MVVLTCTVFCSGQNPSQPAVVPRTATVEEPMSAGEWYNKGSQMHDAGRHAEAITCYDKALELDPDNAGVQNAKGSALSDMGRDSAALASFDVALSADPNDWRAWYNKGYSLGKLGRDEEANPCFDQALRLSPEHAKSWLNKGVALTRLGRDGEARLCFSKAAELDPNGGTGSSARKYLSSAVETKDVEISYTWAGGTNRCTGAKARAGGVVLGDAEMADIGGNQAEGYYVEVDETHYAPDGSGRVLYRCRSRFRIGSGDKITESPSFGQKAYELFDHWPMGQ
jgi:tetratricopeptide (TPR) repeat protein